MPPLNPSLFNILLHNFGEVQIQSEGLGMICSYRTDYSGNRVMDVTSSGEYYVIRCLFCCDRHKHLWINHRWGVYDPETKSCNLWLANCFRGEGCLSNPDNLKQLRELTTRYLRRARSGQVQVASGYCPSPGESIDLPEDFRLLSELNAGHPANRYLRERGFDPRTICKRWGIGYASNICGAPRLVIPIFRGCREKLECYGWQARAIDPDTYPKYYTAHGLKKSHVLYGIHRVTATGPIVICEGVTDAWRIGNNAVAVLGKAASHEQLRLLNQHFAGRPIVVMLDADARDNAHELKERLTALRRVSFSPSPPGRVAIAQLPDDLDPGDCTRVQLAAVIQQALSRRTVHRTRSK